jgi:hypothetical protein
MEIMKSKLDESNIWSSSVTNGDVTKEVKVEKVANGYIMTICKSGYKKKGDSEKSEKEWFREETKYVSSEDPRELIKGMKEDKKEKEDWAVRSVLMDFNNGLDIGVI